MSGVLSVSVSVCDVGSGGVSVSVGVVAVGGSSRSLADVVHSVIG